MPHAHVFSIKDEKARKMIIGNKITVYISDGESELQSQIKEGIVIEAHESHCLVRFDQKEQKIQWGRVLRVSDR